MKNPLKCSVVAFFVICAVAIPLEVKNRKALAALGIPGTPSVVQYWRDLQVVYERTSWGRCNYSRLRSFPLDVERRDGRLSYSELTEPGGETAERITLWWFAGEVNPAFLHSSLTEIVYVDENRDGVWDYRGSPGDGRLPSTICDLAKTIRVRK